MLVARLKPKQPHAVLFEFKEPQLTGGFNVRSIGSTYRRSIIAAARDQPNEVVRVSFKAVLSHRREGITEGFEN